MEVRITMPWVALFALTLSLITSEIATGQSLGWARQAGGVDFDGAEGIAVDGIGNSYVIGTFRTQATFGADEINATTLDSAGAIPSQDIFVAKFDSNGAFEWAKSIGGTDSSGGDAGEDRGWGIAVDQLGNSYIVGTLFRFTTAVDFGNGLSGPFDPGGFVAKYDTNGNALWAASLPAAAHGAEGISVDVDGLGNVFAAGSAPEPILGGTIPTLWKLASDGSPIWTKQAPGIDGGQIHALSVDGSGNSHVTGRFAGTVTFGPMETNETVLTAGNTASAGFVAKYDTSGNLTWAKQFVSDSDSWGEGIDVDGDGNGYTTGVVHGTTVFDMGGPNETTLVAQHVGDMFLAKYDADGGLVWVRHGPGNFNAYGMAISADGLGNPHLTGFFGLTITFGLGEANETTLNGLGGGDVFVAKYARDGSFEWAKQAGGSAAVALGDSGNGIALDAIGNAYVAGFFTSSAAFGAGEPNETVVNGVGQDVFVARYNNDSIQAPVLDLDIAAFRVTNRVALSRGGSIDIQLVVRNPGTVNGLADATMIGAQAGAEVYSQTISVTDPSGNGRTTVNFPSFTPGATGDIAWTATIADQDPDVDLAGAVSRVVP